MIVTFHFMEAQSDEQQTQAMDWPVVPRVGEVVIFDDDTAYEVTRISHLAKPYPDDQFNAGSFRHQAHVFIRSIK